MGRIILLVWAVLSTGILFAQPNMILVKDINHGPNSSGPNNMSIRNKEPDRSIADSKNYQFSDNAPNQSIYYYRIKQADHDGKFSYSRVAKVNIKEKIGVQITPNPSTGFIMISMNANLNPVTIRIFDAGGRLVFNKTNVVLSPMRISVDHLPKGMYVLETKRKNEKHTQKFFKQ